MHDSVLPSSQQKCKLNLQQCILCHNRNVLYSYMESMVFSFGTTPAITCHARFIRKARPLEIDSRACHMNTCRDFFNLISPTLCNFSVELIPEYFRLLYIPNTVLLYNFPVPYINSLYQVSLYGGRYKDQVTD